MGQHEILRLDARSSEKGQVTIPVEIRRMIGLEPGGKVQFISNGDGTVRLIAKKKDISDLFGFLGPVTDGPIDVDQAVEDAVWARTRPDRAEVEE